MAFLKLEPAGNPAATNGSFGFGFGFAGSPEAAYSVWVSSNLVHWIFFGSATPAAPGQFQFTDPTVTNVPARYYRVRSP